MTDYTASELATILRRPIGTIWRWASLDQWRRTAPGRRPVRYDIEDVKETLNRMDDLETHRKGNSK